MTASCCRELNQTHCTLKILFLSIICCTVFFTAFPSSLKAATSQDAPSQDTDFPIFPSIKPNVNFWIDIFSKYSKSQGVIHDTQNLNIIYEIVTLDPSETVRANKKNKKIKKAVNKKYETILLSLSKKNTPSSKEEKRVAALFGPETKPSAFKAAAFNIRCQTGLKHEFKEGLIRSGAVIDAFKKVFASHGLPVDLVYLPCVESSYNFKAYSKFGAAGIWQFTHSTGRQYMRIDYVVDERRDPYTSTDAAARLLKRNYAELRNWPMAITAYNHGLAGMARAKKSHGSYENIIKSYQSRSFKFASRNFYSEFLAARIVAKNHKFHFGEIAFHSPFKFQTIKTKGYLPVKDLADTLDITVFDIQKLNPSLRKPVFNGQKFIPKEFNLKLPKSVSPLETEKKLAALYRFKQKPSRFHRVQKGDTASSIARFNSVKLNDLILANNLNRRATIYIGQNLRIPAKGEIILAGASDTPKPSTQSRVAPPKKSVKTPAVPKKVVPPTPQSSSEPSPEELPKELPEPVPGPVDSLSTPPAPVPHIEPEPQVEPTPQIETEPANEAKPVLEETPINPYIVTSDLKILKTVQKGDLLIGTIRVDAEETLGHYADWLQIPTQEIRRLNKLAYGRPISIDQKINLPMRKITALEFEEKRYEFHKEIEEDFFETFAIQGLEIYEVKSGDTIWALCLKELEIPFWLLKKYNPDMTFNSLQVRQKIKYPLIQEKKTD